MQWQNPQESFLVYGELNSRGFAAKGYRLEVPNLDNAGNALKNDLFMRLSGWLASQSLDKRIQIRYTRDADYRDILERYKEDTEQYAADLWSRKIRSENYDDFMRRIAERRLYREYVSVYFSRELRQFISSDFMPEQEQDRRQFEREVTTAFEADRTELQQFLNQPVTPLDHIGLYKEYYRAVNKSAFDLDIDYEADFEADLTGIYRCGYAKTSSEPGAVSFHSDGYFHNIFTLHDFPKSDLTPFAGNRLLGNDIQNLTIAVNIEPLDTEKVMSDDNLVLSEDMAAISAGEDVATTSTDYFAAVREEYKRRRDTVVNKLHEIPGVVCECPRGAFYIMAALPVDDADAFQKWLLEEFEDNGDTVMFAPGEPFYGTPGKGKNEIRIAYVLKQADLERAMDLLAKGIAAYNAR